MKLISISQLEELKKSWASFSKCEKTKQAKHLIDNCHDLVIYSIGKLKVFKILNHIQVVNEGSFQLNHFNNEQEAIDYALDRYLSKKEFKLFDMKDITPKEKALEMFSLMYDVDSGKKAGDYMPYQYAIKCTLIACDLIIISNPHTLKAYNNHNDVTHLSSDILFYKKVRQEVTKLGIQRS